LDIFEQGETVASVNYVKSGVENSMVFSTEGEATTEIFWNEETDSGWIEEEGEERKCYENFVNAECP